MARSLRAVTLRSAAVLVSMSLGAVFAPACGEETCKTVCAHCDAIEQAECREDCADAYGSTARCRRAMRDLEDCLATNDCFSQACEDDLDAVDDVCDFTVTDYLADDEDPS